MEGIDDWDQSASFSLGAAPRRSTSSLGPRGGTTPTNRGSPRTPVRPSRRVGGGTSGRAHRLRLRHTIDGGRYFLRHMVSLYSGMGSRNRRERAAAEPLSTSAIMDVPSSWGSTDLFWVDPDDW